MTDNLSFDVGIKNLAYCHLSSNKLIKGWGIINLDKNPICDVNLRKKCMRQSSYKVNGVDNIEYCCSNHSKRFKSKKKLDTKNMLETSQTCISELLKLDLKDIGVVLIENQPALKNPIMKSIQMIIYTFFIMNGVMNDDSTIKEVNMVNARNKLKVYKGPCIVCPYSNDKKDRYKKNKYLSIEYTKQMINVDEDIYKELFEGSKKKDDLADAYLQGIYWIDKKK